MLRSVMSAKKRRIRSLFVLRLVLHCKTSVFPLRDTGREERAMRVPVKGSRMDAVGLPARVWLMAGEESGTI